MIATVETGSWGEIFGAVFGMGLMVAWCFMWVVITSKRKARRLEQRDRDFANGTRLGKQHPTSAPRFDRDPSPRPRPR